MKPSMMPTGDKLTIAQVSALTHKQEVKVEFDERVESTVGLLSINGTSLMSGIAVLMCSDVDRLQTLTNP